MITLREAKPFLIAISFLAFFPKVELANTGSLLVAGTGDHTWQWDALSQGLGAASLGVTEPMAQSVQNIYEEGLS